MSSPHRQIAANDPDFPASFPVVGIGASAGGLEALELFFRAMPANIGAAFVVIQHLSSDFESMLDELLARHTRLPVTQAKDGVAVEPDHVFLLPPGREMIISGSTLRLTAKEPGEAFTLPIDHFFRSLGQDQGENSVAIILSGTGADGSRGLVEVHEAGGLVIAQSESSAAFDGMPRSASDTGFVDKILAPGEMPGVLKQFFDSPTEWKSQQEQRSIADADGSMNRLYRLLRSSYGTDFTHYKPS